LEHVATSAAAASSCRSYNLPTTANCCRVQEWKLWRSDEGEREREREMRRRRRKSEEGK
jgi:hypothetical protein